MASAAIDNGQIKEEKHLQIFDPRNYSEDSYVYIDLSDPNEFLTRVQGIHSSCVTKLILTTNLGHKFECGDDYGVTLSELTGNPHDIIKPKKFEVAMTKGAQIASIAGVHDRQKLLSLYAYYN